MHKKCPNTEFSLIRLRENADAGKSVFSPTAGKNGPEKISVFGYFSRSESHQQSVGDPRIIKNKSIQKLREKLVTE